MICEEIFIVDAQPTPKAQKHIDECMGQGVCLCGCGRPAKRRGLADPCYYTFNRAFNSMPPKQAKKYEASLMRRGLILANGLARRIKRRLESVFVKAADEISGSN